MHTFAPCPNLFQFKPKAPVCTPKMSWRAYFSYPCDAPVLCNKPPYSAFTTATLYLVYWGEAWHVESLELGLET
jgi:hypothetical protein